MPKGSVVVVLSNCVAENLGGMAARFLTSPLL